MMLSSMNSDYSHGLNPFIKYFGLKRLLVIVLLGCVLFSLPAPEAKAMDPATIATVVAPIVIPIIKAALPYVIKGGVNFARGMFDVFIDLAGIVMLPVGLFEVSFGAPFGLVNSGLQDLKTGALAPVKMMWSMCLVPVKTCGAM